MTSFDYWADRIPHGHFLCTGCLEVFEVGNRVGMCFLCWATDW